MKKFSDMTAKVTEVCLAILMAFMIALTFAQVVCRFVLKFPINGGEQSIRICFVWIIFLAAAIAVKEGTHLVLDMLTSQLPPVAQRILRILILIGTMVCSVVLLMGSVDYCQRCMGKSLLSLPLPANVVYVAMPISAVLMLFYQFELLINALRGKKEGDAQ